MKKILLLVSAISLLAFNAPPRKKKNNNSSTRHTTTTKKVSVYTSADGSSLRLSLTDSTLQFADFGQPKETQPCVFVDPSKQFQTLVGIGGALTDATATVSHLRVFT